MLADFGIARWIGEPSALTGTNMTVGHGRVRRARAAQGRGDRRARRPVRACRHGLSTAHRHAAVPALQPGGRDQQAPHRRPTEDRHPPTRVVQPRTDIRQVAGQVARAIDMTDALTSRVRSPTTSASTNKTRAAMQRCWRPAASGPRHARQEAKPRRRIVLAAAIALIVIGVAAVGFVLVQPHPRPLRRSQVTPVVRTVYASPCVTWRCHAAGGGRRRELCDVGRGGRHRRRRAGVLRTPVDDECRYMVAVSG